MYNDARQPGKVHEYWVTYNYVTEDETETRQQVCYSKKEMKKLVKHLQKVKSVKNIYKFKRTIKYGDFLPL
jgi:hypothetical protein